MTLCCKIFTGLSVGSEGQQFLQTKPVGESSSIPQGYPMSSTYWQARYWCKSHSLPKCPKSDRGPRPIGQRRCSTTRFKQLFAKQESTRFVKFPLLNYHSFLFNSCGFKKVLFKDKIFTNKFASLFIGAADVTNIRFQVKKFVFARVLRNSRIKKKH